MHVCYVIFFSTVCGSDSHTFHIDWISSILWGAHVRTRGWWGGGGGWQMFNWTTEGVVLDSECNFLHTACWETEKQHFSFHHPHVAFTGRWKCAENSSFSVTFFYVQGDSYVYLQSTHMCLCACVSDGSYSFTVVGGHLIPASQCQVAERTEIVSCSHAHIAAIPGPDRRRESQIAEREEEGSSLRSVSRWPRGPQPGNNGQDGGPSSAISTALLMNFPCWAWETAPQSLHFELVLPLEVIFYS